MQLNENMKLVLHDIYLYDIEACHYSIMQSLGLDLTGINREDKTQRNIEIGKLMKKNPKLTSLLRNTTNSIIDEYISRNNITESDIIIRQYDGIITTKRLYETKIGKIPLDIRKAFEIFIMSINRQMYIAIDSNKEITVKGVPNKYDKIVEIYAQLCKLNFLSKFSIFSTLQKIKDEFMKSEDAELFAIPSIDDKHSIVYLKNYGVIEVTKPTLKIVDTNDIDKERYYKFFLEPFIKSIVIEYIRS